ncbi:MAG: CDP-alcohol phosphatidyltransferase family protein [Ekhidna sp.]|uniref:CDP-alcohol phosphatidyltransferase family protein n=1 Tax=Ekhidna sp. TaxID=2608089 RepID=UPI0032EBBA43
MLGYLKRRYNNHLNKVLSTIKLIDVEERYDLHFSRFYGLYFANAAKWMKMTPTQVSIISLVLGVFGGALFYYQGNFWIAALGGFLVTWAGVLDSADGQLARMTGQSSELGRQIDGLIDNLVFISCYIGGTLYLIPQYGYWVFILMVAAGLAHSYKAGLYEFYKSEYLYLVGKSDAGHIPLSIDEIKPTGSKWHHKIMHYINLDYTGKQIRSTTRSAEDRKRMRELSRNQADKFDPLYSKWNFEMLFWWAWLGGSNTHRNAMVISALFGRFDIYLAASLIWTIGYLPLNIMQRRYDQKLLKELT